MNETNPGTRYKIDTIIPIINIKAIIAIKVVNDALLICNADLLKSGLINETLTFEVIPFSMILLSSRESAHDGYKIFINGKDNF